MDLLSYLSKKYIRFGLYFYVKADDWNNVYCNHYGRFIFAIINPPHYNFSLIASKQVYMEMVAYYDNEVEKVITKELKMLTRVEKIKKIKSRI